ncbi:MAG: hypothetical protein RL033_6074 [Pseudomonadota bacterium]
MNVVSGPPGLDRTLVALADPTRRAILQRLSQGEARVTDLAQPFAISLNSVSKHIQMLERAELVQRRRVGREHFLSFRRRPFDEAARWIEAQRGVWRSRLDALGQLLDEEDRTAAIGQKRATPVARQRKGRSR